MLELKLPMMKAVYDSEIEDSHRANKKTDNPPNGDCMGNLIM